MTSIAVAIKTKRRSGKNYLGETLRNLARAGLWKSEHLHSLRVVDSGSENSRGYVEEEVAPHITTRKGSFSTEPGRTLHQTAAEAIRWGSTTDADWVLVLEDDIDVCDDFLGSVARWLERHAEDRYRMFAFGASYAQIPLAAKNGARLWPYRVADFYGAQALAWRREDAAQLAEWLGDDPDYDGNRGRHHDLLLQRWAESLGVTHFAASVPSFVQHIGTESTLGNDPFEFHSWPGREWSYQPRLSVMWLGDAVVKTGFSRCTHAACDALHAAGHEVRVVGVSYFGDPHEYPYPIYPPMQPIDGGDDRWGASRLATLIARHQPDVVVLLTDPWNVRAYLDTIDELLPQELPRPKIVGWLAVDAANQQGGPLNRLDAVATWTRYGADELVAGGYQGEPEVIPLGVDSELMRPMGREWIRVVLPHLPEDAFVVGVVGRNQPRKRLDLTLDAFARFLRTTDAPNAYLYTHSAPTAEHSFDVRSLVVHYGLSGRVIHAQPHVGCGVSEEEMARIYSGLDVYLSTSQAEGWGLPALEAMSCGVACVLPGGSAFSSWTGGAALLARGLVRIATAPMNGEQHTLGELVDPEHVAELLRLLYEDEALREELGRRGRRLAESLSWERSAASVVEWLERVAGMAAAEVVVEKEEVALAV